MEESIDADQATAMRVVKDLIDTAEATDYCAGLAIQIGEPYRTAQS